MVKYLLVSCDVLILACNMCRYMMLEGNFGKFKYLIYLGEKTLNVFTVKVF